MTSGPQGSVDHRPPPAGHLRAWAWGSYSTLISCGSDTENATSLLTPWTCLPALCSQLMTLLLTTEKTEAIRREIPSLIIGSINPPPLPLGILSSLLLWPTLPRDPGFLTLRASSRALLLQLAPSHHHQLALSPGSFPSTCTDAPFFKGSPFTHPPL